MIFLSIHDGRLLARDDSGVLFDRKASASSARLLGRHLYGMGAETWMNSNIIDQPRRVDFRARIAEGYNEAMAEGANNDNDRCADMLIADAGSPRPDRNQLALALVERMRKAQAIPEVKLFVDVFDRACKKVGVK